MDPLQASMKIAGSGLSAQSARLRVVAENMANAQSVAKTAGGAPYSRKTISFQSEVDRASGASLVQVGPIGVDRAPFRVEHDPGNPAADTDGYVKYPNVNLMTEVADMREANRSYEANVQVMKQTRELFSMTIDLLKGSQ